MFLNDLINVVIVCEDIGQRYGRTRTKGFISIVRVVPLIRRRLSINLLKNLFIKFSGKLFFKKNCFRQTNSVCK